MNDAPSAHLEAPLFEVSTQTTRATKGTEHVYQIAEGEVKCHFVEEGS